MTAQVGFNPHARDEIFSHHASSWSVQYEDEDKDEVDDLITSTTYHTALQVDPMMGPLLCPSL